MDPLTLITMMTLAIKMYSRGVDTVSAIRTALKTAGATPEELADLDARLSTAISARERDVSGVPVIET